MSLVVQPSQRTGGGEEAEPSRRSASRPLPDSVIFPNVFEFYIIILYSKYLRWRPVPRSWIKAATAYYVRTTASPDPEAGSANRPVALALVPVQASLLRMLRLLVLLLAIGGALSFRSSGGGRLTRSALSLVDLGRDSPSFKVSPPPAWVCSCASGDHRRR